jgi:hypothetical protein
VALPMFSAQFTISVFSPDACIDGHSIGFAMRVGASASWTGNAIRWICWRVLAR